MSATAAIQAADDGLDRRGHDVRVESDGVDGLATIVAKFDVSCAGAVGGPVEDALSGRHHARHLRAVRISWRGACGGGMKVIASIEDPVVIEKILDHLKEKAAPEPFGLLPSAQAPPGLFG